ncbi:MAG: DNA-directed RNA polymerase subunit beta [Actinomycetaceae bacterium]|nr:DNA-directed RNA polymerase subunit beta [Actinomycetaceae bacterium]MDY6082821.1 DNA-directed RNA polymerase subunit beta [Actinomycetaceae bacterium]
MAASRTYSLAVQDGKPYSDRVSFAKIKEPLHVPNLIEIQTRSYGWLIGDDQWKAAHPGEMSGLEEIFADISPIENLGQTMGLVLSHPHLEEPKYSIQECREHDLTYSAPLYVTAEFQNYETGEIKSQTTFIGDFPIMTEYATFIVNGSERVVVSQLVRSPGVYFERTPDKTSDKDVFGAKIIPSRGAWLEFEIDKRESVGVRVDRKRKQSVTVFLKAIGMTESEIRDVFSDFPLMLETLEKDTVHTQEDALRELYRKLRPGDPATAEAGRNLLNNFYFNNKRYSTAKVGRYKINKKLGLNSDPERFSLNIDDITATLRYMLALQAGLDEVVCAPGADSVPVQTDDIDHFGNRRIRAVGELIQNQMRTGLARLDRMVRERMTTQEAEAITPASLINIRPIVAAIKEFFGTSQLSQFMDQVNPLAGLTHKRRLSALGPGGLSRERAGMEVRDVHPSHYGRMCPIETPEGQNIGLIGSLAAFARLNSFGFIETPYRVVKDGRVTDEIVYLQADDENGKYIAQAEAPLDADGHFSQEEVLCRTSGGDPALVPADEVDYQDVSARQMTAVGTAMIPFLEHDDAHRALMGANMQRQAVPLIRPVAPYVGTGMEVSAAVDAGDVTIAKQPGVVTNVDATAITVEHDDGTHRTYRLKKFMRSNAGTSINQHAVVSEGDRVETGSLLADGPSTYHGELALGQNLLVALMGWNGYNYEDAVIISERLVKQDVLTSIHIIEHEVNARDSKLGPEEITRDVPNVSEDALSHLDDQGIIRIGAEVDSGDILVGKITPKGETELTSEERLLRAIFGEKAKEVRDTSLRVPHGEWGVVTGIRQFTKENAEEMPSDVNETVHVWIAQRRKITVGDKMSGRHGNKGVISRILPEEDMPFMEDGTPVDIILNPLGVPSRMNLGQVYELHLGWIASQGWDASEARSNGEEWAVRLPENAVQGNPGQTVATPVFDGVKPDEIDGLLANTLPNRDGQQLVDAQGKAKLFDGRTGEPFPGRIAVGYMYMLKLNHLVDDKIHARSTGPYAMVTQQPLGGKAQFGGQRFGEMEVWALEAYGASHTLQEMLTVKSDDTVGRVKVYEAIVKGDNFPEPGIPESFKVLMQEMRSLCLDVEALDISGQPIDIRDEEDDRFREPTDEEREESARLSGIGNGPSGLEDLESGAEL